MTLPMTHTKPTYVRNVLSLSGTLRLIYIMFSFYSHSPCNNEFTGEESLLEGKEAACMVLILLLLFFVSGLTGSAWSVSCEVERGPASFHMLHIHCYIHADNVELDFFAP